MSGPLVLAAGDLELHLLPAIGGGIARFERRAAGKRQQLLRGTGGAVAGPLDLGCFPLVPFVNRVRGGAFGFRGRTIRSRRNMPPDPSPIHGHGWQAPWHTVATSAARAELRFHHPAGDWPWEYEARLVYQLDPGGLAVLLTCRNLSGEPMPCGLGLHPYYTCDATTVLDTAVECAWTVDEDVLPVAQVPAEGRFDLRNRAICGQDLDNGFGGWSGRADIVWRGEAARLRLSSPDACFFQVYSPASGGLFVAEPVQHANAALNAPERKWPALGLAVLERGEERRLRTRFEVLVG